MKLGERIERMIHRIPRLPRKWRVVRNLACTVLLAAVFILPRFDPEPLTPTHAFYRECRANLLGQPEIIWQQAVGDKDKLFFVADDGDRYIYGVFQRSGLLGWQGSVIPWEKDESGLTLMPFTITRDSMTDIALTLVLFHDVEGVRRAEVDIPLENEAEFGYHGESAYAKFSETYTEVLLPNGEGVLEGIMLTRTEFYEDPGENIEGAAYRYAEVSAIERLTWGGHKFPITVRLYDNSGNVLREEKLEYSFPQW